MRQKRSETILLNDLEEVWHFTPRKTFDCVLSTLRISAEDLCFSNVIGAALGTRDCPESRKLRA